jgi:hypothetical protein
VYAAVFGRDKEPAVMKGRFPQEGRFFGPAPKSGFNAKVVIKFPIGETGGKGRQGRDADPPGDKGNGFTAASGFFGREKIFPAVSQGAA